MLWNWNGPTVRFVLAWAVVAATLAFAQEAAPERVQLTPQPLPLEVKQQIDALVAKLDAEEFTERENAIERLEAHGFDAFPLLRQALATADEEKARRIRTLIGPYDEIMEALQKLPDDMLTSLYHEGPTPTMRIILAYGSQATPYIEGLLIPAENALLRFNGITMLNHLDEHDVWPILEQSLEDPHPWCRVEAVWALGNYYDGYFLEAIAKRFTDPDATVRKEARLAFLKCAGISIRILGKDGLVGAASAVNGLPPQVLRTITKVTREYLNDQKLPTMRPLHELIEVLDGEHAGQDLRQVLFGAEFATRFTPVFYELQDDDEGLVGIMVYPASDDQLEKIQKRQESVVPEVNVQF